VKSASTKIAFFKTINRRSNRIKRHKTQKKDRDAEHLRQTNDKHRDEKQKLKSEGMVLFNPWRALNSTRIRSLIRLRRQKNPNEDITLSWINSESKLWQGNNTTQAKVGDTLLRYHFVNEARGLRGGIGVVTAQSVVLPSRNGDETKGIILSFRGLGDARATDWLIDWIRDGIATLSDGSGKTARTFFDNSENRFDVKAHFKQWWIITTLEFRDFLHMITVRSQYVKISQILPF
jgi:hypothetical protein